MKQILILILTLPLFIACSNDKEDEPTPDFNLEGITGTVWRGKSNEGKQMELNFYTADSCYIIFDLNDMVQPPPKSKYTYKYEYPNVYLTSIYALISEILGIPAPPRIDCTISKNKISLMLNDNNEILGNITYQSSGSML